MRKSSSSLRQRICLDLKTLYHGGKKAGTNVCVHYFSDLFNILGFHKHRGEMLFTLLKPTEALFAWPLLQGKYYHLIHAHLSFKLLCLPIAENKNKLQRALFTRLPKQPRREMDMVATVPKKYTTLILFFSHCHQHIQYS